MTKNRTIPFGYRIHGGRVATEPNEAWLVQSIFSCYLSGNSYKAIAVRLSQGDVPYHTDTPRWNKNMIKRILENRRYLGSDEYPAIIDSETFVQTAAMQRTKTQHYNARPTWVGTLTGKVCCDHCGAVLQRDTRKRYGRWHCPGDHNHPVHQIRDDDLADVLASALNHLIENPKLVDIPATELTIIDSDTIRLNNEIRRCTEKRGCDESAAIDLVYAAATARYNICDDDTAAVRARQIRRGLTSATPSKAFDAALFSQTVREVHLSPQNAIRLTLLTGQTIEGTDFV